MRRGKTKRLVQSFWIMLKLCAETTFNEFFLSLCCGRCNISLLWHFPQTFFPSPSSKLLRGITARSFWHSHWTLACRWRWRKCLCISYTKNMNSLDCYALKTSRISYEICEIFSWQHTKQRSKNFLPSNRMNLIGLGDMSESIYEAQIQSGCEKEREKGSGKC